jgi:hypothetical protein
LGFVCGFPSRAALRVLEAGFSGAQTGREAANVEQADPARFI